MSYTTEFIDDGRGVLHVGTGVVHGDEIHAGAMEDHRVEARARALRFGLVDLTDVTELRITSEHVRAIAAESHITARLAPHVSVAIVAPRDSIYGMARMWEILVEGTGWDIRIVRLREEALEWLRPVRLGGSDASSDSGRRRPSSWATRSASASSSRPPS
jgi:hypothetical protein